MLEPLRTSKGLSLIALFAALHTVLSILPFSIAIGVSGGSITLGIISATLIGITLGPISGGLAVLIGSVIGMFLNPSGALLLAASFLPPTMGAISSGFLITKRGYISAVMLLVGIIAFYSHTFGLEAIYYPFMHIIALVLALIFSTRLAGWSKELSDIKKLSLGIPIAAFVGTLTDHIIGSSLYLWMFELPAQVWNSIIFIYPIERIVAVIITAVITLPLLYSLNKSGILNVIRR